MAGRFWFAESASPAKRRMGPGRTLDEGRLVRIFAAFILSCREWRLFRFTPPQFARECFEGRFSRTGLRSHRASSLAGCAHPWETLFLNRIQSDDPAIWRVIALSLAVVSLFVSPAANAQYASGIVRYQPGIGYATEFGTQLGYTDASAALGEPSRSTPGDWGGPVDPFSPAYLRSQVVSLGAGGVLEVRMDAPVRHDAGNPYGMDFLVFGTSGFVIVNGDYSGGGVTDGSLFGGGGAEARISVSADGARYFTLDPALSPALAALFPTDGTGDFTRPVNPALGASDFAGLGLDGIRVQYQGSGGGTGFSLAWARDESGGAVELTSAQYIRVEVTSGRLEIDGFAGVRAVPEPASGWMILGGVGLLLGLTTWRNRR
jgi:hypothetical protein